MLDTDVRIDTLKDTLSRNIQMNSFLNPMTKELLKLNTDLQTMLVESLDKENIKFNVTSLPVHQMYKPGEKHDIPVYRIELERPKESGLESYIIENVLCHIKKDMGPKLGRYGRGRNNYLTLYSLYVEFTRNDNIVIDIRFVSSLNLD